MQTSKCRGEVETSYRRKADIHKSSDTLRSRQLRSLALANHISGRPPSSPPLMPPTAAPTSASHQCEQKAAIEAKSPKAHILQFISVHLHRSRMSISSLADNLFFNVCLATRQCTSVNSSYPRDHNIYWQTPKKLNDHRLTLGRKYSLIESTFARPNA